ncbi:MAG: hypothetical protein ACI87W_000142 [Halieaceae bacterium]|jgi:hypothetical protein
MHKNLIPVLLVSALAMLHQPALAKISEAEAARLDGPQLTPVGAERGATADGSIPVWEGGITELPEAYVLRWARLARRDW